MPLRRSISHRSLLRLLSWQQWVFLVLAAAFLSSGFMLLRMFYMRSTLLVPTAGGTYIEGSVGELLPLNPWFTVTNDVNRDIVSLIFSGLLRYNPETQAIEDDLATMEVSSDGRIYTLTLKDGIEWHDSTPALRHYVTAEDILFTFQTVQDPQFPNSLLHQNFRGVTLEQLGEKTVRFKLEEPYRFFPSNLTLGLLPRASFEGVPVDRLDQVFDFGFHPVGAGPYAFRGLVQTELSTEVTLERFPRSLPPVYHLDRVIFRIFSDYTSLLSDLRNLHGVRLVPHNEKGEPMVPRRFTPVQYTLPQYVALFFNLEHPYLRDPQLRLALQIGTNKQAIVDTLHEKTIIDTPLLEIDVADWRYQYDPQAAQGALFTSNWNLPEKVRLQRLLEFRETNSVGALQMSPIVYLDTGAVLTVTGSIAAVGSTGGLLNGYLPLTLNPAASGAWIAALPTQGTGAVRLGENKVTLQNDKGETIDSFYLWRTNSWKEFKAASLEQELVDLFLQSRAGEIPAEDRVTVADFFLSDGMLRRRQASDPTDVRVNERGEKLSLRLLTSPSPPQYRQIAEIVQKQWAALGVHVGIEIPETRSEFEEKMLRRDYAILLFGQSLLDNLDSYPYWHSSGIQKQTEDKNELLLDAYNLSQYSSFQADALLEFVRKTGDEKEREEALQELREILKENVPATFLYSPIYTFAYHQHLHGVELGDLSLHSDRFLTLHNWFVKEQRVFKPGKSWWSFFPWLFSTI
ncbi:MAG: ABC transporter substrate-binding protein [Candidatus Peribacteraceae bacterium]|nr:ABC transporter substrate-binding protein [Candidatus Peribacteraceae bacterium]